MTEADRGEWDQPSDKKYKNVKQKIQNNTGCRVKGSFKMYQVPSKMLFATDRDLWLIKKLKEEASELFEKFSLEHYYESLSFGDQDLTQWIQSHFSEYPEHTKLDMVKGDAETNFQAILASEDKEHYNHFKYISVVPHIFVDTSEQGHEVDFRSYSYALTTNKKPADGSQSLTMVYMNFDFSPVSMMFTKSRIPLARFLINVCAIVGGVFVVFGIINSILLQVQKTVKGE